MAEKKSGVDSLIDAAKDLIKVKTTINPDPSIAKRYEAKYAQFSKVYPACKGLFKELNKQ